MEDDNDPFLQLHEELTSRLLERVRDGTATAADLNVARQWLNDNQIKANPRKNKPLKALGDAISQLPFEEKH